MSCLLWFAILVWRISPVSGFFINGPHIGIHRQSIRLSSVSQTSHKLELKPAIDRFEHVLPESFDASQSTVDTNIIENLNPFELVQSELLSLSDNMIDDSFNADSDILTSAATHYFAEVCQLLRLLFLKILIY